MTNTRLVLRYILGFIFCLPFLGQAQTQTTNFTTTGTWTCPTGVTSITVECWGGGGAGAAVGGNPAAGGGGAGGAYARKTLTVVPGTGYTITVGASKPSGTKTATATANTGNPTWFGSASTVYAAGGPGAAGGGDTNNFNGTGATGTITGSIGDVVYAGGNGANGASTSNTPGGAGGGAAGTSANGGNASTGTGGTGGTGNPNTGRGANGPANSTVGAAGSTYGGGGAGGKANTNTDRAGGAGAAGYLRLTYQNNTPINFAATPASSTQINLTWTDNSSNETGFEIWTSSTSGGTYTLINTTAANATTYNHTGLTAGTAYYYKIKAINSANNTINSAFTSEVFATTLVPPSAPTSPAATSQSSSSIILNWTDMATNETGYQVMRSTTQGGTYNLISTTSANATSYIDKSGLGANTTYYYVIRAVNATDNSAYTAEVSATTFDVVEQAMSEWSFQYKYDARRRMTAKKVPGADWVYMVYDSRDRLVLTQDGNQSRDGNGAYKNEWAFTKYDALNRPVMTGIYTHSTNLDQAGMQTVVDSYYANLLAAQAWHETYSNAVGNVHLYDNKSFPQVTNPSLYLTITYYDNYDFKTQAGWDNYNYADENLTATVINGTYNQPDTENLRVLGQVTGSKTKVLDAAGTNYIKAVTYYDDKYRAIQTTNDIYKNGVLAGTDRTTTLYDFPGKALKALTKHNIVSGTPAKTIARRMEYDHAGRLLRTYHQINSGTEVLLSANEYNELGQPVDKKLYSTDNGTTFKQSVDYRYNIRGWMTKINEADVSSVASGEILQDYFGMELAYNTALTNVSANAQFNGNISAVKWSSGANGGAKQQGYGYEYDAMNRLLNSNHNQKYALTGWAADNANQETGFSYDMNGNILGLQRKGTLGFTMDNLSYGYTGNQLNYVHDAADAAKGFANGNTGTDDYSYDVNGNMTVDKNKGITAITYNHLNLPTQVNKGATDYIVYTYDASGRKLSQRIYGSKPKTTDYAGEFIYQNDTLQFINHEEGRILPDGAGWEYQYHLKDYLGNVRVTFTTKAQTTTVSTADFENSSNTEFQNYNRIGFDLVDHTDAAGTTYSYVQKLYNTGRTGVAKSIAVMPGDQVTISAYAKYMNLDNGTPNTAALITSLATAFNVSAGSTGNELKLYNGLNNYAGTVASGDHDNWTVDNESAPKAFVTILFFDKDYNLVDAAWDQVTTTGAQTSAINKQPPHDLMSVTAAAKEAGYAYVFVSNEHPYAVELFVDDVTVSHTPSPIVSSSDYYAFGMGYGSSERTGAIGQSYLYNGKEKQDELDLGWYDYGARMYMPDIGRWGVKDPLSEKMYRWSPYCYAFNNPVRFIDPTGMEPEEQKNSRKERRTERQITRLANKIKGQLNDLNALATKLGAGGFSDSEKAQLNASRASISSSKALAKLNALTSGPKSTATNFNTDASSKILGGFDTYTRSISRSFGTLPQTDYVYTKDLNLKPNDIVSSTSLQLNVTGGATVSATASADIQLNDVNNGAPVSTGGSSTLTSSSLPAPLNPESLNSNPGLRSSGTAGLAIDVTPNGSGGMLTGSLQVTYFRPLVLSGATFTGNP